MLDPVGWFGNGPSRKPCRVRVVKPLRETAPGPVLRAPDQRRSARVPLDVAADPQEVMVSLDGNVFEATLVHCALARRARVHPPPSRVGRLQPLHRARQRSLGWRRDDEMPMVRHEAVRKKRNAEFFDGDGKERFERVVITCRFEKQAFSRPAVDNVEDVPSGSPSPVSGHAADGATGVPHLVAPAGVGNDCPR